MGANIPLPALGVQPPPQQNLIGNLSQLMGIKSAMAQQQLQQQMAPLQVQASQQENQQRQQSMDDLKASTAAMQSWDGKNLEDLPSLILKHGGSANAVFGAKQQILAQKEKLSQIAKDDAQTGKDNLATLAQRNDMLLGKLQTVTDGPGLIKAAQEAAQQGLIDPQHAQTAAQIAQLPPDQFQQTLSTFEKSLMGQKAQFDEASKVKDQALAERKQAFEEAGGLPPEKRVFADYLQTPPKPGEAPHTAANFPAWNAAQEAAATQPYKIAQVQAEEKAKQLMSGLAEPVYAMDAQGNKTLTSKTAALQGGAKTILPVTEKEVTDDTMLINRLGDVRQKIARYEQALQKPISYADQNNLGAVLGTQGMKVGAFGTEIPMDRVNAALEKENLQALSPAARDQLIAYRNAREALTGYTRVLSGSGRSSDTSLELNEQTLPNPASTDRDFSTRSIGQFKENLKVVGQGLPNIPGIKTPEQWENEVRGNSDPQSFSRAPFAGLSSLLGR